VSVIRSRDLLSLFGGGEAHGGRGNNESWEEADLLDRAGLHPGRLTVLVVSAVKVLDQGQVFAIIQIPALGQDWKFTVIEGTDLPQLATGPGHVPGTALPGAEGNAGIAAHDVTAGTPTSVSCGRWARSTR
jgi:Sortase domain